MFVDRKRELEALLKRLDREGFELIIVYGRRRIGKTRLVLEALRRSKRPYVYYQAVEIGNIYYFKNILEKNNLKNKYIVSDWEALLSLLKNKTIVLDEFPYIVEEDPSILSKLQRLIDQELEHTSTKIILLGSSISLIKDKIIDYGSPLHGRTTARLKLEPMNIFNTAKFHRGTTWKEKCEIYGFAGGVPLYHARIGRRNLWKWLREELETPGSWVLDEPEIILRTEFRESRIYRRILEAIAWGKKTRKEISEYTGIENSKLSPYLQKLETTGLIEKRTPYGEPPTSKRSRYEIRDLFLGFWHRYIQPNLSAILEGSFNINDIRNDYSNYMGHVFEIIARQFLAELNRRGKIPFHYTRAGPWWYREWEVDLVAANPSVRKALLVEVKWSRLSYRDLERIRYRLEQAADHIPAVRGYEVLYAVIAREFEDRYPGDVIVWGLRDFDSIV